MGTATERVVRVIPQMVVEVTGDSSKKLQVAAYARVSTEKEEQEDSFERQVEHYTHMIQARPEWTFAGIYADPGITGTRSDKRPDFNRMIGDCRAGRIQKILVKSIARFARNTVDALSYINELKDMGISVFFESENVDTLTPGGELLITILAAMAEQESRTISSNIKWAYQKRFEKGNVLINTGLVLGYRKAGKDDKGFDIYEIDDEEAELVRRIYREYLAGMPITRICRGLEADGIKTKLGKGKWYTRTVQNILGNEIYTGNATLGKTFKPDVLSKRRIKNTGQHPLYHVSGSHPAIISDAAFRAVAQEMKFRSEGGSGATSQNKYTSKYPFSGILICGHCGARLRRQVRTVGSGKRVAAWGCSTRIVHGRQECDSHHVNEAVIENTYREVMRQLVDSADEIVATVSSGISETAEKEAVAMIQKLDEEIMAIQERVLQAQREKTAKRLDMPSYNAIIKESSQRIRALEEKKESYKTQSSILYAAREWTDYFKGTCKDGSIMDAQNGFVMKQMVKNIVIYDDHMQIRFKCGVTINQKYCR